MDSTNRGESGFTLIEIILSVAILGVVFVGMLGALGTIILGSDVHRNQADANAVLISAAEKLKDPAVAYELCATPATGTYLTAARSVALPPDWQPTQIEIDSVTYWNGTEFTSTCNDGTSVLRLQQITLSVVGLHDRADERFDVVKRGS